MMKLKLDQMCVNSRILRTQRAIKSRNISSYAKKKSHTILHTAYKSALRVASSTSRSEYNFGFFHTKTHTGDVSSVYPPRDVSTRALVSDVARAPFIRVLPRDSVLHEIRCYVCNRERRVATEKGEDKTLNIVVGS